MRAVIVGGGTRCKAIIKLALGSFLTELSLDIVGVVDPNTHARGMVFARQHGILTTPDIREVLSLPDINLVIELTGKDDVLQLIYKLIPPGIKVLDHTFAKVFVDLNNAQKDQADKLMEIRELESRVEKERSFLQTIVDNMPQLVAIVDRDKRLTRMNASFSQLTKIHPEKARGKKCSDLLAGTELSETGPLALQLLDLVLESDQMKSSVWQSPPPHDDFWELTHIPIRGPDGRTEKILCTWHRITRRAILQHKIDAAEMRFQSFMDSAHDWISVKDLEGRYLAVNKIAAEQLHLKPEDFIGKRPTEVLPNGLAEMVTKHDRQVLQDDRVHSYTEIVPIDGRDQHFLTNRFPLKDYRGNTIGICNIMRNVTSEMTLRRQLEQAGKLAAIGKLAAGVAHEINNPLTGVLAYAEGLLEDTPEADPRHEDLAVIMRETMRCRDIVRNLLDFSRQENPKFERLDPNEVVDKSLSLVERLPEFRNIEITTQKCDTIPQIQGDPQQIQQVLLNFMMNAAEAMQGKGNISVITQHDQSDHKCIIGVEDNGPGIPENLRDKIFEPFFSTKGTNGLGLAVSWGIVERHFGTIEVEMSESGGASFRIIFPAFDESMGFHHQRG